MAGGAGLFRARTRSAWVEAVTRLSQSSPTDEQFAQLSEVFTQEEIVNLTITIAVINTWNRIAVSFNFFPDFKDL